MREHDLYVSPEHPIVEIEIGIAKRTCPIFPIPRMFVWFLRYQPQLAKRAAKIPFKSSKQLCRESVCHPLELFGARIMHGRQPS